MIRETPNFTFEQELACPRCGGMLRKLYVQDNRGRHKRQVQTCKRPEKKGPWGPDDVLEEVTEKTGRYTARRTGRVLVHKVEFMCSKCCCHLSRGQAVPHEFSEDELPYDFYQEPYGEYLPEEEPKPEEPATDPGDPYDLADLF